MPRILLTFSKISSSPATKIFTIFVFLAFCTESTFAQVKIEPYFEFHDIFDPYNHVFSIDGGLGKHLHEVDDWNGAGPGNEGVLDCYGPGLFDNSKCPVMRTLFRNPCGKHAILACDAVGDLQRDDIFSMYDFEHGEPTSWGRMQGAVPEEFDITRAMLYNKKVGKTDFLMWGIEFLPCKHGGSRTFVFEFNARVVNFTSPNETVPILDPLRKRGDLLLFVHFKPHHGIEVEVYYLKDNGHYYNKHDRIVKHDFPFSHGTTRLPTFLTVSYNDRIVPAAIWSGIVGTSLSKNVEQPYTFFEGKLDLEPIKKLVHGDIVTNWVTVRSMDAVTSELANCKLRDVLGPFEFKLGHPHIEDHPHDPYGVAW